MVNEHVVISPPTTGTQAASRAGLVVLEALTGYIMSLMVIRTEHTKVPTIPM